MKRSFKWEIKYEDYDTDDDTTLHFAAASGENSLIFNYLSVGYDVNVTNKMGWTPLMLAARQGHTESVELLVEFGADVLHRNRYGISSIAHAVASGNLETVRVLLNKIIEKRINLKEIEKPVSPVIFAILFNHVEILQYLLRKSFKIPARTDIGDIPITMFRAVTNNKETLEFLERFDINTMQGMTSISKLIKEYKSPNPCLQIPNISFCNEHASTVSSPFLEANAFNIENKVRKFSNLNLPTTPKTPDISPILSANSPTFFSKTFMNSLSFNSPKNDYLDKRFSFPMKSNDVINKFEEINNREVKGRSHSYNAGSIHQQGTRTEVEDDVFEVATVESNASFKNREFIELLRKHSLDSCIQIFERNEIDMDVFLTLSKGDLDEIGINWDKRADVLELIYLLNK